MKELQSLNPATGQPLGAVAVADAEAVGDAVRRAQAAQAPWGALPIRERAVRVRRFTDLLLAEADRVIDLLAAETGKPRGEALVHEVVLVADLVNYFARRAPKILASQRVGLHLLRHRQSELHYVPRGVVAVISPWNFPFAIPVGEAMMALIAGNAVVLKPSELTPLVAVEAKRLHDAAGLPPDLFQVVCGGAETGRALVDADVQYCVFTGSVAAGRKVAGRCGERLIPCTVELGGKAPAIVCADAPLTRTAGALVWGGLANSGQACASVERVYAHAAVHDELVADVTARARALRQGDPLTREVDVGAMTMAHQVDHVDALVRAAVASGARVETGGRRRPGPGQFYEPTVLTGVTQDMAVMRQEIFGPVIPIMQVRSDDEAVDLANDSHLGLLAYVFTSDREHGRALAARVAAGTVMINDVLNTYGCPETPWGGIKASGLGRTHSPIGLRALCELRHINREWLPSLDREPLWYPYSRRVERIALRLTRFLFGQTGPFR